MDTQKLQNDIRTGSLELRNILDDFNGWEKDVKSREKLAKLNSNKSAKKEAPVRDMTGITVHLSENKDNLNGKTQEELRDAAEEAERTRGNQLYSQSDYDGAIKAYSKCLILKECNYTALSNRAMCYLKIHEYVKCELDCTIALSYNSSHVKSLLRRASAKNSLSKHRSALSDLLMAQSIELNSKNTIINNNNDISSQITSTNALIESCRHNTPFITIPISSSSSVCVLASQFTQMYSWSSELRQHASHRECVSRLFSLAGGVDVVANLIEGEVEVVALVLKAMIAHNYSSEDVMKIMNRNRSCLDMIDDSDLREKLTKFK